MASKSIDSWEEKSLRDRIERLNGEKYLLFRYDEQELKRTVCSIIVRLSLQSTTRLDKIVVVTETDRKARAFDESLSLHGPNFSSCLDGDSREQQLWGANIWSTRVLVCRAAIFFRMCSADHWPESSGTDPARMLVVYLDVLLETLVKQKKDDATVWTRIGRLTSVLAACGRIRLVLHEQLLGWNFCQENMEHLFKSVLTRGPNNKNLDYIQDWSANLDETLLTSTLVSGMIPSGGIVVIGKNKELVFRLTDRLKALCTHQALDIEPTHVFCPQQQDATNPNGGGVASGIQKFDRVARASGRKAVLLVSLRALKYLDTIESAFKHAKMIFFVGLPFTHLDLPSNLKLYATFDLMNSLLREFFEVCRETPGRRALFIMDMDMLPNLVSMLPSELHDIEFEDFFAMASRLKGFLAG
jgi:hypothetical protein